MGLLQREEQLCLLEINSQHVRKGREKEEGENGGGWGGGRAKTTLGLQEEREEESPGCI